MHMQRRWGFVEAYSYAICTDLYCSYRLFDDLKNSFDVLFLCICVFQRHGYGAFVDIVLISVAVAAFRPVQCTLVLYRKTQKS